MKAQFITLVVFFAGLGSQGARAETVVRVERSLEGEAGAGFRFERVGAPRRGDVGAGATFRIVEGERDGNGGALSVLQDGVGASRSDQPGANFFFRAGSGGGRVVVDLGKVIELGEINSYSWHPGTRGPQVYRLYVNSVLAVEAEPGLKRPADLAAAEGLKRSVDPAAAGAADLRRPADPVKAGWRLIASVDTRPKEGAPGGQYGVSITDSEGKLGSARQLLFDILPTETDDAFGETFYSEIDVVERGAPPEPASVTLKAVAMEGGAMRFTVDTGEAPDLTEWAHRELVPVLQKWYPLIVKMLPSEGYTAPRTFSVTFTDSYHGVAATTRNRIEGSPEWYRGQLRGEALGSMVHELVHVAQQYGQARRAKATPSPGWLVEGLADYIRWYLYEPQSKGCEILPDRAASARYDAGYRDSANFLNFVSSQYDRDLIRELNAAMREGSYEPALWEQRTHRSLEELVSEWKRALALPK